MIFNELAKFQQGGIPSCLSFETPCIVNCMQFQLHSGAKDIVSVEKTFPFAVEVIGITNLKLVSTDINFQDITNEITDILFQSVQCSFPIGQLKKFFNQPENLLCNWDFPQPFQRRRESMKRLKVGW